MLKQENIKLLKINENFKVDQLAKIDKKIEKLKQLRTKVLHEKWDFENKIMFIEWEF